MQLGRRAQILLLIAIALAVYYPAIVAELSDIDDVDMVAAYSSLTTWNLKVLFMPGTSGGFYYRPLIGLSFLVDHFVFQQNVMLLHLHNVALHILNAVLVYFLAQALLSFMKVRMAWFPLTAALCFCLHPIVTESVAWVSGRTDLLASVFVLSSAIMLFHFRMSQRKRFFIGSLCLFLLATLTKEVSLAFFPGMVLILAAKGEGVDQEAGKGQARAFFLAGFATALLFFLFRSFAFTSNTSRIGVTLNSIGNDLTYAVMVVLGAFGFYMKKIILPLPLSFAIVEVDPLYQLLGIPLVVFCAYLLTRRSMASALYLCGVFLIAPSFVLAFHQISWTSYAERYLYLPTAFLVISMLFYLGQRLPADRPRVGRLLVIVLLALMATATFARNMTWRTNFSLVKDTVEKSPYFPQIRLLYANQLRERGEFAEAIVQAKLCISPTNLGYDERPELFIGEILHFQGKTEEALKVTELALSKRRGHSETALQQLIKIWKDKVRLNPDSKGRAAGNEKLLELYRLLYAETKDPAHLYSMGLLCASLGQNDAATGFFQRTISSAPAGSDLRARAGRGISGLVGL